MISPIMMVADIGHDERPTFMLKGGDMGGLGGR